MSILGFDLLLVSFNKSIRTQFLLSLHELIKQLLTPINLTILSMHTPVNEINLYCTEAKRLCLVNPLNW